MIGKMVYEYLFVRLPARYNSRYAFDLARDLAPQR